MTNYNVLFLDIDGTILRPDHTIEDSTKHAINQVRRQGIEVFLATGRPLHEVTTTAKELEIQSHIGYNGALATYKNKQIVNEPMEPETIKNYLSIAKKYGHELVLYTSEKNLFTSLDKPVVKNFIEVFKLEKNELFTHERINEILGITLMNLNDKDIDLYDRNDSIYLSQVNVEGLHHCYDVIRENVNKGSAVKSVLNLLDVPPEKAIAFGDGMNDKAMLQFVGESFAMGNSNHNLFQYAKHRTTAVTNSGIFNGLKSLGLLK